MHEKWRSWYNTNVAPFLSSASVESSPPDLDLALLAADTDKTQAYIFESTKLPEIRGASELLRALNEEALVGILADAGLPSGFIDDEDNPGCVIYAGGGSLLAFVPTVIADELAGNIESLYPSETGKATISCVWRAVTSEEIAYGLRSRLFSWEELKAKRSDLNEKVWQRIIRAYGGPGEDQDIQVIPEQEQGFGQVVQLMGLLLRQRKDNPVVLPSIETLSFATRCKACQVRPAQRIYKYFDELWPLCDICRRKVLAQKTERSAQTGVAKQGRKQQVDRFLDWLVDYPDLKEKYEGKCLKQFVDLAQDMAELGTACRSRPGYVGFVYADGNRMGRALEFLPTPKAYRIFSYALQNTLKSALYQTLAELLEPVMIERTSPTGNRLGKGYIHPFEPLIIGGDDVMLLLPGDAAIPVATRLCQLFERQMRRAVPDDIWAALPDTFREPTLSAGVVIADSHNPVSVLQKVAQELCKNAKRRAYAESEKSPPNYTSAVDFLLLKSQSMLRRDVKQLRRTRPYYFSDARNEARLLTAAPYTLTEIGKILDILNVMRQVNFSTSQLQGLVAALQRGRQYGTMTYLYQEARLTARLGASRRKENVLNYVRQIWAYDNLHGPVPWHKIPSKRDERLFASIVPDLLELYPFVPKKSEDLWRPIFEEVAYD